MSESEIAPGATGGPQSSGRLKWLLVASLAANLLLVGAFAGPRFFGHRNMRGGERSGEEFGLIGYARHLPAERRKLVRKIVEAERASIKALREDVRKVRQDAGAVLVAEPFDAEQLKVAVGRIGEAEAKLKAAGLSTLINAAQQFTPEERQGLLEHWKRRQPRHFRADADEAGAPPSRPKD